MKNNINAIFEQFFGETISKEHPFNDVVSYINGLNYSALGGFPPHNASLYFTGEDVNNESEKEDLSNFELHIDIALSGFKKEEITVQVNEDMRQLSISAIREDKSDNDNTRRQYISRKLSMRDVKAKYSIPFNKIKEYSAKYENGVLSVIVKPEKTQSVKDVKID